MSGRIIPLSWGRGTDFQELGHCPLFWPFMFSLGTVITPVGVSFSMLMYYSEHIMRLRSTGIQSSAILNLVCCNQWMSYPQLLCHSFKGCALPPSCLIPHWDFTPIILWEAEGDGLFSVAASKLSKGISPLCQRVKISGFLI